MTLIDRLAAIVGDVNVITSATAAAPYLTDWRGRYTGSALCVVRPASTAELAAVVAACAAHGTPIVPQGGNTGLVGGATPRGGEVVVGLTRLKRIRGIDRDNATLTVEAGCTLQTVQEAAAEDGFLYPLSLAAEGTATIGGTLSTNAGGVQVLRYGNARDLVLGVEVVLADGCIWNGLRGLRKDNTGYDLKQLFIGAEGTLGIISAAVLKLLPLPRASLTAWAAVADPAAAVAVLRQLQRAGGERLTAFEIVGRPALDLVLRHLPGTRQPLAGDHDWQVLIELSDTDAHADLAGLIEQVLGAAISAGQVRDAVVAASEAQAAALWALRENISEAQKRDGLSIKHDVSLPVSRVAEFIARADALLETAYPGVRVVCFGHVGDGNLHYNPSKPIAPDNASFIAGTAEVNRIVHDLVAELGGSISAEHGLGQLKREEILRYKSPVEIELMRKLKQALDPAGLMNPGKLI